MCALFVSREIARRPRTSSSGGAHFATDCVLANGLGTTETGLARQLSFDHGDPPRGVLPVGYPVRDMDVRSSTSIRAVAPGGRRDRGRERLPCARLLERPDLTNAGSSSGTDGGRYFTGDLGRLGADGASSTLGAGRRPQGAGREVEPAEVERELLRFDGVREAAVVVTPEGRGDGRVVAFVVAARQPTSSVRAVLADRRRPRCSRRLVELDALPLGPNGKVDRVPCRIHVQAARRGADAEPSAGSPRSGRTSSGRPVGADDDFFALGGDSLAAAEIVARIETETARSLPLAALIAAPRPSRSSALRSAVHLDSSGTSSVTVLHDGDDGPLDLVHGNTGDAAPFARLCSPARDSSPLWGLESFDLGGWRIDSIVAGHVEAAPDGAARGPVPACWVLLRRRDRTRDGTTAGRRQYEAHLALLGITPFDFPTAVAPDAYERWRHFV